MILLAYFAGFFAALALLTAAKDWWKVVGALDRDTRGPALTEVRLRSASFSTVIAFGLLGVAVLAVVLDHIG